MDKKISSALKISITAFITALLFILMPPTTTQAAEYTVTLVKPDGTSAETVATSATGVYTPSGHVYYVNAKDLSRITGATNLTENTTIIVIDAADITDSGNVTTNVDWILCDNKLFVIGSGTITRNNAGATMSIPYNNNKLQSFNYSITQAKYIPQTHGDEKDDGYNEAEEVIALTYDTSASNTTFNITEPAGYAYQTVLAPWETHAADIETVYIGASLSGDISYLFNANAALYDASSNPISSKYSNLKKVYIGGSTSGITHAAGTFANISTLEGIYVPTGSQFDLSSCIDLSYALLNASNLENNDSDVFGIQYDSAFNHIKTGNALKTIKHMMDGDKKLSGINLENFNTQSVLSMFCAFRNCDSLGLTASDLAHLSLAEVQNISYAFYGSTDSANVISGNLVIPAAPNLKTATFAFGNNSEITGVTFTGTYGSLENTVGMFSADKKLATVNMDGLNTASLKYADAMFYLSGTSTGTVSGKDMTISSLEDASAMFAGAGFKTIDFTGTNFSALKEGAYMFSSCKNLTTLTLDNANTMNNLEDGRGLFLGDNKLESLNVSGWTTQNLTNADRMFSNCSAPVIDISGWDMSKVTTMDYFMDGCGRVTEVDIAKDFTALTSAFRAFADMSVLNTVTIDTATFPLLTNANGMFASDPSLQTFSYTGAFPSATDVAGMFHNDAGLTSISIPGLITGTTTDISYMLQNCVSLEDVLLTGWNTSGVTLMQGLFDGDTALKDVDFDSAIAFTTAATTDTGTMFRNCAALTDDTIKNFIQNSFEPTTVTDAYEMFKNTDKMKSVDLKGKDFSALIDASRMFYQGTSTALDTITLPTSFLSATSAATRENVFYVPVDTLTELYIAADTIPDVLANYDWDGDNRVFLSEGTPTINSVAQTTYKLISTTDTAAMAYPVTSKLYKGTSKTNVEPTFSWTKDGTALTTVTDSHTTDTTGVYKATAALSALANSSPISQSFTITDKGSITSMTATYVGDKILVGGSYTKDNVVVKVKYEDNSEKTISSANWTPNSLTVSKNGNNTYTASYTDAEDGNTYTANYTVPGYRAIGSISIDYIGPNVITGEKYDTKYITATAYYADDTTKSEGFAITPTSYSTPYVEKTGANTITGLYVDPNTNTTLSDTFTVTGYVKTPQSITATYNGPAIPVGGSYKKEDVTVTVKYSDGTTATTTAFTVNSNYVPNAGNNSYTATLDGYSLTAPFTVTGYTASSSDNANTTNGTPAATNTATPVKTGDNSHLILYIAILVAALGISGVTVFIIRRKHG